MSLPQPPTASTTVQDSRALPSHLPAAQLPAPQFSPGAHLDRDEAFALKRPGEELGALPNHVPKKPKHSRRPSQIALDDAPPAPNPLPAAPAAAPPMATTQLHDSPIARFNLWLNAIRLPLTAPRDWPGDKLHWRQTADEELAWMKGEVASDGSDILAKAWAQLRATPQPDEHDIKTLIARVIDYRRTKAGRGSAVFPLVPTPSGAKATSINKDGKVVLDLTLDDTPEPEEPRRPSTSASVTQPSAAPTSRPPLTSHPSAPASRKVAVKARQPPLASPDSTSRPDSAPPTMPVIRPPAVRARIANPLARASPTAGEAAQAKQVPSQPVIYGNEGLVLSPQLAAPPFLVPPAPPIPPLSPPLLPPGQSSPAPALQPPTSSARAPSAPTPPPPPPPAPVVASAAPKPQPPAISLSVAAPAILLPNGSRERTVSREERQQPKSAGAEISQAAARATIEMHRSGNAPGVAEQRSRQRSTTTSSEYSPLRPSLDLPQVGFPATRAEPPSSQPPPRAQQQSPTDAERGSFANSRPPAASASATDDAPRWYTIGSFQIPPAMTECFLLWFTQYGEEAASRYITAWGEEIGLLAQEMRAILTALITAAKDDKPGWAELERRHRVSLNHLERVGKEREREWEERRTRLARAEHAVAIQQQQQRRLQQQSSLGVASQQRQQQLQPRVAQAAAHLPSWGPPSVGDMLNNQQAQRSPSLGNQQQQAQMDYSAQISQQPRRASGGSPALAGSPTFAAQAPPHGRRASDGYSHSQGPTSCSNYQLDPIPAKQPAPSSRPRTAERAAPPPSAPTQFGPSISPISPQLSPHLPTAFVPPHPHQQQQPVPPVLPSPSPIDLLRATLKPFFPGMQAFVNALDSGEIGRGGEELERKWNGRLKAMKAGEQEQGKEQQLVGLGVRTQGSSVP